MISASLNRCKGLEDQVGDLLSELAAKLELALLLSLILKVGMSMLKTSTMC